MTNACAECRGLRVSERVIRRIVVRAEGTERHLSSARRSNVPAFPPDILMFSLGTRRADSGAL